MDDILRNRPWEDGQDYLEESSASCLIKLRAEMVRMANEVDALADLPSIRDVRGHAPSLANRIRDAAMTSEMVKASKRA